MSDLTLVAWIYFKATNYSRYNRIATEVIDSPDFQYQFYGVLLQSLTFALLLFIVAQFVVYVLAWKNFRGAYLYLKYFAVFGFAGGLYITVMSSSFAFVPMMIYMGGYYVFAREFKILTAELRNLPQSATPQ